MRSKFTKEIFFMAIMRAIHNNDFDASFGCGYRLNPKIFALSIKCHSLSTQIIELT